MFTKCIIKSFSPILKSYKFYGVTRIQKGTQLTHHPSGLGDFWKHRNNDCVFNSARPSVMAVCYKSWQMSVLCGSQLERKISKSY